MYYAFIQQKIAALQHLYGLGQADRHVERNQTLRTSCRSQYRQKSEAL